MVKTCFTYILIGICLGICSLTVTGCATTGRADTSNNILDYQRQVALLEGRIALYESAVGGAISELRELAERASSINGGIDEIISLFDEYQRGVDKLLRQYRKATAAGEL